MPSGISKVLLYLTSFSNTSSPPVSKRSVWIAPSLKPFWGKALLFVYLPLYFHPAILASCHLSLSPSYKNSHSLEFLLIGYIIPSLHWFQPSAKPLLIYNHVLLVHKSTFSKPYTSISMPPPSLLSISALLNSLSSYPSKANSKILFPVLQMPSIPLFLSPTIKLMDKMAYRCLQLSSWIFLKKNYPTQLTGFTLNSWLQTK